MKLAVAYSENQLKKRCIQIIRRGITVENAAFCYSIAIEYNAKVNKMWFYLNKVSVINFNIILGIGGILFQICAKSHDCRSTNSEFC